MKRLEALGFTHTTEGRVHTFTQRLPVKRELLRGGDDFIIYADPRMDDRVVYRVYYGHPEVPVSTVRVMDKWNESRDELMRRLASTLCGMFGARAIVDTRDERLN